MSIKELTNLSKRSAAVVGDTGIGAGLGLFAFFISPFIAAQGLTDRFTGATDYAPDITKKTTQITIGGPILTAGSLLIINHLMGQTSSELIQTITNDPSIVAKAYLGTGSVLGGLIGAFKSARGRGSWQDEVDSSLANTQIDRVEHGREPA